MSANTKKTVTSVDLLKGEGALTFQEVGALATEYRTAVTAVDGASFRKARVAYVVNQRGAMDADGALISQKDLAKTFGVTEANISQDAKQMSLIIGAGFDVAATKTGAQWAKVWATATALRKVTPGRDKGAQEVYQEVLADVLADIAAMPEDERAGALAASIDTLKAAAKDARDSHKVAGEAQTTPETSGEAATKGKADVISAIGAIAADVAENGYALRTAEAEQVARYLAEIARNLGVDLAEVAALVAA